MESHLKFHKTKEYLICIDSDGCVMDTMNIKHIACFGPKVVEEWNLQEHKEMILEIWNHQNLFSKTRGINRFAGLSLLFETLRKKGIEISGFEELTRWCQHTTSLSNDSLKQEIESNPNDCLRKALSWSIKVNEAIQALPKQDCVFPNAKAAMEKLYSMADIAIVSSANKEAIHEEWQRLGCMEYVSVLCGQDAGTKSYCISELKKYYEADHVLMIGDALSDLKAAQENEVAFYPILAGHEADSWLQLMKEDADKFFKGEFDREFIDKLAMDMKVNLR